MNISSDPMWQNKNLIVMTMMMADTEGGKKKKKLEENMLVYNEVMLWTIIA